jgi:hypothetical protein
MNTLTTQTQGAFDRIEDVLVHDSTDNLDLIIERLQYLLVRAQEIKTELSVTISGDYQ